MPNTNLKLVDEDFVDNFFGGIFTEDETPAAVAPEVETPEETPAVEETTPPTGKKPTVLSAQENTFDITDLLEEEILPQSRKITSNAPASTKPEITTPESDVYINELISEGVLFGFDEEGFEIKTKDDLKELIEANKKEWKRQVIEEEYEKDFQSLPYEMQYAVDYIKKGGTDMKRLFKALSQNEETRELDPEKNPRETGRAYLQATSFGTAEEIEEQLDEWQDMELLTKKAKIFKPKLDKISEDNINAELKYQEEIEEYKKDLADKYFTGISETLKSKKINGLDITVQEQNSIYKSLTENNYTSTRTGTPMNFLGKFLEEITWDKPNYELLSELALFAKDPDAYRDKIRKQGKAEEVIETERKLRTGQTNIKSQQTPEREEKITLSRKTLGRINAGLLKR